MNLFDTSKSDESYARINDLSAAVESVESVESVSKYTENYEPITSENIQIDQSSKADCFVEPVDDDKSVVVDNTPSDKSSKSEQTDNNVLVESFPDDELVEVDNTQTDFSSREEHIDDNVVEEQSHITVDNGNSSCHFDTFDPYIDIKVAISSNNKRGLIETLERQKINWSLLGENECMFYNLHKLNLDKKNRAVNITGDGSCLFRSISLAIKFKECSHGSIKNDIKDLLYEMHRNKVLTKLSLMEHQSDYYESNLFRYHLTIESEIENICTEIFSISENSDDDYLQNLIFKKLKKLEKNKPQELNDLHTKCLMLYDHYKKKKNLHEKLKSKTITDTNEIKIIDDELRYLFKLEDGEDFKYIKFVFYCEMILPSVKYFGGPLECLLIAIAYGVVISVYASINNNICNIIRVIPNKNMYNVQMNHIDEISIRFIRKDEFYRDALYEFGHYELYFLPNKSFRSKLDFTSLIYSKYLMNKDDKCYVLPDGSSIFESVEEKSACSPVSEPNLSRVPEKHRHFYDRAETVHDTIPKKQKVNFVDEPQLIDIDIGDAHSSASAYVAVFRREKRKIRSILKNKSYDLNDIGKKRKRLCVLAEIIQKGTDWYRLNCADKLVNLEALQNAIINKNDLND